MLVDQPAKASPVVEVCISHVLIESAAMEALTRKLIDLIEMHINNI